METGKIDINKLSEVKRELLSRLLREKTGAQGANIIPLQEKKEYYPLSYNQEQLWFLDTLEKDNPFYNVPSAMRFKKEIDIRVMQAALNQVVHRQQILKTSYINIDGKPYQKIESDFTPGILYRDLQGEKDPDRQAREMLTKEAMTAFSPGTPPLKALLFRLSAGDYILMIKFHHILIDGWSIPIFNSEFLQAYRALEQDKELEMPALSPGYVDFALWQRRKIREGGFDRQLQYWRNQLSGDIEPLDLPTDFPRPKEQTFRGKRQTGIIPASLVQQLKSICKDTEYTLFMVVVAGFSLLLSRYSNKKDILMGTQMANRIMPGLAPLIGYFSNSVVLRFQAASHLPFKEYLRHVKEVTRESQDNQEFPFEKLVQELRVPRTLGENPLFQAMLVYRAQTGTDNDFQQFNVSEIRVENGTSKFDLDLLLIEAQDKINISIIYNTDIFTRSRIERMAAHFENILRSICRDPDQRISNIDFLTDREKHKILYTWNDTGTLFPKDCCLHSLFEQQAVEVPGAFCLYYRDRQVNRKELAEKANQLAWYLKKCGIGPNRLVAICIEKSVEMVIGLTAILKAGGGYLPIDPTYPPSRIEYMLTHSGAGIIVTQDHLRDIFPGTGSQIICLDCDWEIISRESTEPCPLIFTPGDIVYGIFTSGSTGNPKMTVLDHRGRVNNFTDFNRRFKIGKQDRLLAVSSLGFDMCAYDILGSLACGSAIVLPEPDFELQPGHWAELMVRHEVTIWHSVPSKLELLAGYIAENPAYTPAKCRLVLLGGDWIPLQLPDRFREFVPGAVMVSLGGATEVSMDSTIYIIENVDPTWKSIPYGVPMANQLTYIVDANFNLVPEGIPGELCIGGVGVGWGYYGNPALTAGKFIPNPWSQIPGDRVYRTGDLARYNADGILELLGRIDLQVKIRGYRIELGEIEAVLNHHELIDKALVMAKKDMGKDKNAPKIIACVIPVKHAAQKLTRENLRLYLKDRLPGYFIPTVSIFLDRFPLTPNGKIDRRALLEFDTGEEERGKKSADSFTPPASKIEKLLATAWKNLLELDDISIHDNFFSLGGDSIKCIQLVTRAREAGLDITLKQLFRHQTIFELAKVIESAENINIKGSIPLTSHQYLVISEMNTYNHPLVDSIWLELPNRVTPGMCQEALSIITRDYDCFKLRFQAGEAGWWQSYDDMRSNLMYFTHVEIEEAAGSVYEHETVTRTQTNIQRAINLLDGPVLGAALFTVPHDAGLILLLAVPRLILSGISRYGLIEDLARVMFEPAGENLSISLTRGSFVKWACDNEQELFKGPIPVNHCLPVKGGTVSAWQSAYFSLDLSRVSGVNEVLRAQPLISLAEMVLSALCSALAQENKIETISMDVLLSDRRKTGDLPPPGCHGDFFTLRTRTRDLAAPADSVKWVHRFMAVHKAGNQAGPIPRQANNPLSVSVQIVETGISPGMPGAPFKIKSTRGRINLRQCSPVGTNALQLTIRPNENRLWIGVVYDRNERSAAAVESFYHNFREMLNLVPRIYLNTRYLIYREVDFPGTGITGEVLSRLFQRYPGLVDIYSPGPMQRYILQNRQRFSDKGLYVIQYTFYLPGSLDVPAFEKSWQQLIRRYDILRTVFFGEGLKEPVQVVLEDVELTIGKEDWREKSETRQKKDLVEFMEVQRAAGFDFEKGPLLRLFLLRLSEDRYLFIQFNSYIILDGWSVFLLRKELLALYRANAGQTDLYLPGSHRYRDYIDWVNRQDPVAARDSWKQVLQGLDTPTLLYRAKRNQENLSEEKGVEKGFEIQTAVMAGSVTRELQRISRENRLTFSAVVMGGWYLVLRDWLKRSDLVFGVTSSGRPPALKNVESIVGLLVNTIPSRVHWEDEGSFIESSHQLGEYLNRAASYEYITLDDMEWGLDHMCRASSLFDTVLVFDNYPVDKSLIEAAKREEVAPILPWDYLHFARLEMPLRIAIWTGNIERTSFVFSYYRDRFSPHTIAELSKGLIEKLALIAESPGKPIKNYLTPKIAGSEVER